MRPFHVCQPSFPGPRTGPHRCGVCGEPVGVSPLACVRGCSDLDVRHVGPSSFVIKLEGVRVPRKKNRNSKKLRGRRS